VVIIHLAKLKTQPCNTYIWSIISFKAAPSTRSSTSKFSRFRINCTCKKAIKYYKKPGTPRSYNATVVFQFSI